MFNSCGQGGLDFFEESDVGNQESLGGAGPDYRALCAKRRNWLLLNHSFVKI